MARGFDLDIFVYGAYRALRIGGEHASASRGALNTVCREEERLKVEG